MGRCGQWTANGKAPIQLTYNLCAVVVAQGRYRTPDGVLSAARAAVELSWELLTSEDKEAQMADDPSSPKVVAIVRTEMEAALIVNRLADEGIQALVAGAGSSTGWPEAPGDVQVVGRQEDLARAKETLALIRRPD